MDSKFYEDSNGNRHDPFEVLQAMYEACDVDKLVKVIREQSGKPNLDARVELAKAARSAFGYGEDLSLMACFDEFRKLQKYVQKKSKEPGEPT